MKRWPSVRSPLAMPSISNGTTSPSKTQQDALERPHPAQRPRPPAHRLGPGEAADDVARPSRRRSRRSGGPGWRSAANQTPSRSTSWSRVRPVERRKPSMRLVRRADARALALLGAVGLGRRQALGHQGQAARAGEGLQRPPAAGPAAASRSRAMRSRSRAACACMRAGISSEKSSSRSWGIRLLRRPGGPASGSSGSKRVTRHVHHADVELGARPRARLAVHAER